MHFGRPVFLSTLPARGATRRQPDAGPCHRHISIHAPREGSDERLGEIREIGHISIHAPREGSDRQAFFGVGECDISIHAPREGSDPCTAHGGRDE